MATLQELRQRPHWSYSSLNSLLNICSLQWCFERIEKRPKPFTPLALSFGSTFHRTIEWFNRCRREGIRPGKGETADLFQELWKRQLEEDGKVRFPEGKDEKSTAAQGRALVACYAECADPEEEVVSVNETFAVPVPTSSKVLIGEMDLVVRKEDQFIVTDLKSSARRWPKGQAHKSLQPTTYLYGYHHLHPEHGEVPFRFDIVVKNKTPVFEQHTTVRDLNDMFRLCALIEKADEIVKHELYYPSEQGFYCGSCPFAEPCRAWHRNRSRTISVAA